jgi:hypothetical protein
MKQKSGVSHPKAGCEPSEKDAFDHDKALRELLENLAENVSDAVILDTGKTHFAVIKLKQNLS